MHTLQCCRVGALSHSPSQLRVQCTRFPAARVTWPLGTSIRRVAVAASVPDRLLPPGPYSKHCKAAQLVPVEQLRKDREEAKRLLEDARKAVRAGGNDLDHRPVYRALRASLRTLSRAQLQQLCTIITEIVHVESEGWQAVLQSLQHPDAFPYKSAVAATLAATLTDAQLRDAIIELSAHAANPAGTQGDRLRKLPGAALQSVLLEWQSAQVMKDPSSSLASASVDSPRKMAALAQRMGRPVLLELIMAWWDRYFGDPRLEACEGSYDKMRGHLRDVSLTLEKAVGRTVWYGAPEEPLLAMAMYLLTSNETQRACRPYRPCTNSVLKDTLRRLVELNGRGSGKATRRRAGLLLVVAETLLFWPEEAA